MQYRKMPSWKAPEKDGVQGYWLKSLTSLHSHIVVQLNHILDGERSLMNSAVPKRPGKMTFGKTVLC